MRCSCSCWKTGKWTTPCPDSNFCGRSLTSMRGMSPLSGTRLEVRSRCYSVLLAEREPNLRAVVVFSGAGYSFDRSPELRARLLAAIDHVAAPVFFIHAENDLLPLVR